MQLNSRIARLETDGAGKIGVVSEVRTVGRLDVQDVSGCVCLRLRKAARRMTRHYDAHLAPSGLTIGQFGFLAGLHRAQISKPGLSLTALAGYAGMDPTTLNRSLKPLVVAGLIDNVRDPHDRRARLVFLTPAGRSRLAEAMPLWQRAEAEMIGQVGRDAVVALNRMLDLAHDRLSDASSGSRAAAG